MKERFFLNKIKKYYAFISVNELVDSKYIIFYKKIMYLLSINSFIPVLLEISRQPQEHKTAIEAALVGLEQETAPVGGIAT